MSTISPATAAKIDALRMKEAADIDRLMKPVFHKAIHKALSKGFNFDEIACELAKQAKCSIRVAQIVVRAAAHEAWMLEHDLSLENE
jgi:hypothetical protein